MVIWEQDKKVIKQTIKDWVDGKREFNRIENIAYKKLEHKNAFFEAMMEFQGFYYDFIQYPKFKNTFRHMKSRLPGAFYFYKFSYQNAVWMFNIDGNDYLICKDVRGMSLHIEKKSEFKILSLIDGIKEITKLLKQKENINA